MIMPREKKEIQKEDIMPLDVYTKNRKELRKNIVNFKKDRRIALGPYATFYFESYETMLAQVVRKKGIIAYPSLLTRTCTSGQSQNLHRLDQHHQLYFRE